MVPPSWQTIAKEVCGAGAGEPPPRVCIVGAKSTGKSTMSRLIANALLARAGAVVYLDTDMGQGEFSPPGTVAATLVSGPVFGPPWMQQAARPDLKPWVVRYLGDTSPQGDPVGYLRAVQALLADAAAAFPNAPVVVNTHGWTRGTGLDLLLEVTCPTVRVYAGGALPLSPTLMSSRSGSRLVADLGSGRALPRRRHAADGRVEATDA